jgi:DNA-binding HxlR family transcriptional regulator
MDTPPNAQTSKQDGTSVASITKKTDVPATRRYEDCEKQPMTKAIHLIGDVWILLIVVNLLPGTKRFNELLEAMGRVSSKTLSQRLKLLEELGMVERQAFYEIPPRVEYRLTDKGRDLGKVIEEIEQFAQKHLSQNNGKALENGECGGSKAV